MSEQDLIDFGIWREMDEYLIGDTRSDTDTGVNFPFSPREI